METTFDTGRYPDIVVINGKEAMGKLVTNHVKDIVFTPKQRLQFSYMVYLPPKSIKEKFPEHIMSELVGVYDNDWEVLAVRKVIEYCEEALGDVIYME